MGSAFSIGRIFGITIKIDWSWIFIFLLVTWNLGAGVLPQIDPQWSTGLTWFIAVVASLLFFASVLAHELAHSLVAKAQGVDVKSITLFLFGGVSNIQREPPSPLSEFLIAIVGPITSIVLGFIFALLGGLTYNNVTNPTGTLTGVSPWTAILLWLGPINIILGIFNLIPGFPLDGGRVLRSILWGITNNLRRATRWASWIGEAIGWLFIILGVIMVFGGTIPVFGTGFISGLWLAFIGWFLRSAASQSYQQLLIEDMLEGVPVSRMMRAPAEEIDPNQTVSDLVYHHIMGTDERAFPVVENGALVGLVCLEDVRKIPRDKWDTTVVRTIMTPRDKLTTASPQEEASEALTDLVSHDVNQVPVVENGRLVGMLRRTDILRWLQLQGGRESAKA